MGEPTADVPFPTLLKQSLEAEPRPIDSLVTLESVERPQTKKLAFRYALTRSGKIVAVNSDGDLLRKIAVDVMKKDPLAISAVKNKIAVEHIFNDESGSMVLSIVMNGATDVAIPVKAEPIKSKTNVTGVQTNPFLQ
jgi:hypothetical protein